MTLLDPFQLVVLSVAIAAGGTAAVSGFGIGSLLTPLLGTQIGIKLAVAVVSIPHLIGTAFRFLMLREHVDKRVLLGFGLTSAAGGLVGALLHAFVKGPHLMAVFGLLLVVAGVTGLLGITERLRLRGAAAWIAGALSGLLGGLVGNQGGIRSAALLGFDVPKQAFVATATVVGLIVDGARMPVYLIGQGREVLSNWPLIVTATVGVVAGTVVGNKVLKRIPEKLFQRVISAIVLCLGIMMLYQYAQGRT
jgi:uncharacterized membrane protein YfcA